MKCNSHGSKENHLNDIRGQIKEFLSSYQTTSWDKLLLIKDVVDAMMESECWEITNSEAKFTHKRLTK